MPSSYESPETMLLSVPLPLALSRACTRCSRLLERLSFCSAPQREHFLEITTAMSCEEGLD